MVDLQRFEGMIEDIEEQERQREERNRQIGEKASAFPTREEYLEKDTEERLSAAKGILAEYAPVSVYQGETSKWAGATIDPEDEAHPNIVLKAEVGYRSEDEITDRVDTGRHSLRSGRIYRTVPVRVIPEAIPVRAFAQDTQSGTVSDTKRLGQFREGSYTDEEGEKQNGWHVFRLKGKYRDDEGDTLTLQSQYAQDMVELVDAAVLELIDGVVSDQRKFIGGQAVEGAVEQPPQ